MVDKCPYTSSNNKVYPFDELSESKENEKKQLNNEFDALSVNSTRKTVDMSDNEYNNSVLNRSPKPESKCPYNEKTTKPLCPYSEKNEEIKIDTEKEKCPYSNNKAPSKNQEKSDKCPYSGKTIDEADKNNASKANNDDDLSEDEEPQGGCPVMNTKKNDPANKHFEECWELPFFGPFDFMFDLRGMLDDNDYKEKTKTLKSYNRHLLYTLFNQNDEKLNKVREKEFPLVFFIYDDIKIKGNKYFRKSKYKEALDYYFYVSHNNLINYLNLLNNLIQAYSTLKWLVHKDSKKGKSFFTEPSLDPVLDEEVELKTTYLDAPDVETDSYKASIVYLLLNMSSVYLERRHFSEAIKCLDEAEEIAGNKVPDVFFRRCQARTYNKYSKIEDLEKAKEDMEKAFESLKEFNEKNKDNYMSKNNNMQIYTEHKERLLKIIEKKLQIKSSKFKTIFNHSKESLKLVKERNKNVKECFYYKGEDQIRQYKILRE